ncbi:MAG: NADH-quinone oxidoreductase subunit NuoH [Peptococcaceae bacterium]|nr:MAG: NADH-quinone oxidoreductase subunit NuoH [Peptococcaceae bacterium]
MVENIFVGFAAWLRSLLDAAGMPALFNDIVLMIVKVAGILAFIAISVLWIVYMERKMAAYFQARIGPNRVGPKGLLQTAADMGKLISKEIIIPRAADKLVFLLMPVLIFVPSLLLFAVVPFGKNMIAVDLNVGVFYFFAVASLSTIIFWAGGWASANKYALIGAMRAVAQMISYEVPMVLAILGVIMIVGSMKMSDIINAQQNVWFIFTQPVAFVIYVIAATAETNRTPFDLLEGESEIIAGPFIEYGGMGFAMWFLAEYANLMLVSALATTLFLGGWLAPFGLNFIPSWVWFLLKIYFMIWVFMWFRWTYPRIRVDQLMNFGWKVLVPLSLANIFVTGIGMFIYRAIGW